MEFNSEVTAAELNFLKKNYQKYVRAPLDQVVYQVVNALYTEILSKPDFKEQTGKAVYVFMEKYFEILEPLPAELPKHLFDTYIVMLKHFLESALPYSAKSVNTHLKKLKLNKYAVRIMNNCEHNGFGEDDAEEDTMELSREKAKGKELMNVLAEYSAWYNHNNELMLMPCAFFVAKKCEEVHSKTIDFPDKMDTLDEYSIPIEVPFNAAEHGKVCIIQKTHRKITASSHDLEQTVREIIQTLNLDGGNDIVENLRQRRDIPGKDILHQRWVVPSRPEVLDFFRDREFLHFTEPVRKISVARSFADTAVPLLRSIMQQISGISTFEERAERIGEIASIIESFLLRGGRSRRRSRPLRRHRTLK